MKVQKNKIDYTLQAQFLRKKYFFLPFLNEMIVLIWHSNSINKGGDKNSFLDLRLISVLIPIKIDFLFIFV